MSGPRDLTLAAVQGILAGLALLACSSQRGATVSAPMETTPSTTSTPARLPPVAPPIEIAADPTPKDCCRGMNQCKGLSGCESSRNDCRGKNECKGLGTACDASDETAPTPRQATPRSRTANCCSGKNECKGKSGCRTAHNPAGAGRNDCKGAGTACPRK
jgi:hypothetical protein